MTKQDKPELIRSLDMMLTEIEHTETTNTRNLGTDYKARRFFVELGAELRDALLKALTPTHRHLKRGSEYVLIGYGKMQAEDWHDPSKANFTDDHGPSVDMAEVAIYRSIKDGSLWVRPKKEFEDGRFIPLNQELRNDH